jgi:thiosulfate/3-mercaptopyruvate sulfurtransferase
VTADRDLPLLVSPAWLESRLADPGIRIVDATWYLPAEKRSARDEYAAAHVPGAIFLDLSTELADLSSPLRNTVAPPERLAAAFAARGIGTDHRVVVYDRRAGYSAGRVWWTLRYAGHPRAALLDGGFARWQREGRPVTAEAPRFPSARFDARPEPRWLARKRDVLAIVAKGGAAIVDARSADRFRGEGPETARRAGHVPGSVNVPYAENFAGDPPVFRDAAALRARYEAAGVRFGEPVVTTCGSGVTAALDAFALVLAGHADVSVYDGSWDEWGNADDTPVEQG